MPTLLSAVSFSSSIDGCAGARAARLALSLPRASGSALPRRLEQATCGERLSVLILGLQALGKTDGRRVRLEAAIEQRHVRRRDLGGGLERIRV